MSLVSRLQSAEPPQGTSPATCPFVSCARGDSGTAQRRPLRSERPERRRSQGNERRADSLYWCKYHKVQDKYQARR